MTGSFKLELLFSAGRNKIYFLFIASKTAVACSSLNCLSWSDSFLLIIGEMEEITCPKSGLLLFSSHVVPISTGASPSTIT